MLKKIDFFRPSSDWHRKNAMDRYLFEVILYRDDKRIKTTKTTDHIGNPYIPGSYRDLWNPILGLKLFSEVYEFLEFYRTSECDYSVKSMTYVVKKERTICFKPFPLP